MTISRQRTFVTVAKHREFFPLGVTIGGSGEIGSTGANPVSASART
jgi:hypothetical protein